VVKELYSHICNDERHDRVTLVREENVEGRTFGQWAMAKVATDGGPDIPLLSNAQKGGIVVAAGHAVTPEQESILAFMRASIEGK